MADVQFPVFKTKIEGLKREFDLTDAKERERYFEAKAGKEIKKLRKYLKENTFIVYLMGKKNSGKGTYAKMFKEVVNKDRIEHLSIGDVVRSFDEALKDKEKRKEFIFLLGKNYRGYHSLEEIIKALENRSTKTLLPSELVLALVKGEIRKRGRKALFIDGFPRELDQVSYSLFFRDLIDYRQDPDIFALIDVPESVIDERIKYRVICPTCQTSRNLKLLPTKEIGYDKKEKKFFLICDNTECENPQRMVTKEGDEWGVEPIRERLKKDGELMDKAFSLYGIPKILLRNSVPADKAKKFVDDYEVTPEYVYQWDEKNKKVKVTEKPWQVLDKGVPSNSLLPPPVVVALIKQMVEILGL